MSTISAGVLQAANIDWNSFSDGEFARYNASTGKIEGAVVDLSGYLTIASAAATYAPIVHTHAAADVVSGTFNIARIPTIPYSGLTLTGAVLNADLAGNIALSKLATDPLARANHTGFQAISTVTSLQGTLDLKADLVGGTVPSAQLPAYVDDVVEAANFAALPGTGEAGKIYVTLDNNLTYRWSGSAYVEISASLALGETNATAYRGDRGKTAYDHSQLTSGNPHNVTPTQLGLVIGTNVQAYNANLTTYASIAPSANVQTLLGASNYAAFKTSLSLNNVENTALSTWAGSSNLTTLGTIGTGVWNGTAIADSYIASSATWNAKQAAGNYITALTGDVTAAGPGSSAATIGAAKVTNAMLAGSIDLTTKVTGILPAANGGTGVNNGSFNLTVPATGTAALLGTANVFTALETLRLTDAVTNAVSTVQTLQHRSSGTPAALFGLRQLWQLNTDTGTDRDAAAIDVIWEASAAEANHSSALILSTVQTSGAPAERVRIADTGMKVTKNVTNYNQLGDAQVIARGSTNNAKMLMLGFDTSNDIGFVSAGISGVSWNNLILQSGGGNVGVGIVPTSRLCISGNFTLAAAGNKVLIKEGTNASMGVATLASGTVTVSTTLVTANSRIFLTPQDGTLNVGSVWISARTASTSFVISSSNALDARNVGWCILEPA